MFQTLYNIFIMPVEHVVELIFYGMNKEFADIPGMSIIFVSLIVNLLILPLYKRADDMQEIERDKVKSMEPWVKHIRSTFKGDERYMMQTAYYRIVGYKPLYAITGSLSLLFQIPFFMAAYHFLSHATELVGSSFLSIPDLSAPDALIRIGSLSINLLPILMTVINILSGMVYTKGFKIKDKLQLYGMALLFLVILYNSPSGLVLYWTCNNIFSLGKNIFFKYVKHKRLAVNILSATFGVSFFSYLALSHRLGFRRQYLLFGGVMLLSFVPAILSLIKKLNIPGKGLIAKALDTKPEEMKIINTLFWLGCVLNVIILGIKVPAELVAEAPVDFSAVSVHGPLPLVFNTFTVYLGLFIVWIGIFYAISGNKLKKLFAVLNWLIAGGSFINYYFFFGKFGVMDYNLRFGSEPVYNDMGKLINLVVLLPVVIAMLVIFKKWPKIVQGVLSIMIIMCIILSGVSIVKAQKQLIDEGFYASMKDNELKPTVPLSKDGQNVIIIMLDRAINEYIPYVFNEKPELAASYDGFVYYPNTVSFAGCTNLAAPALYGGYEYTPTEMNLRASEPLVDKHNEALSLLPVLFADNGYNVDVCDPPYANYQEYPDISIFDDYDGIEGHITRMKYDKRSYNAEEIEAQRNHFFYYSIFRTAPVLLQHSIYDDGNYMVKPMGANVLQPCAEGYATLDGLETYTYVEEGAKNELFMLSNLTTHEPTMLELPDYNLGRNTPNLPLPDELMAKYVIDGEELYMYNQDAIAHYHTNMAAYLLLGEYFDYLREQGVYDNTRIILVSDHGWPVNQRAGRVIDDEYYLETYNPVLFVKDFADSDTLATEECDTLPGTSIKVCKDFMTNADVPVIALRGIVDNPVNPFTGKPITDEEKTLHPQLITTSYNFDVYSNNGTQYDVSDRAWLSIEEDIFDLTNWQVIP